MKGVLLPKLLMWGWGWLEPLSHLWGERGVICRSPHLGDRQPIQNHSYGGGAEGGSGATLKRSGSDPTTASNP